MRFTASLFALAAATVATAAPSDCGYSGCGDASSSMMMDESSTMMMDESSTMMMDETSTMMMDSSSMMMDSSSMMMDSSSTMMADATSTMMMDSSSTMMSDATSTMMMDSSSTMMADATSTQASYATASYGSGSSSWGGSSYDSCVQQCVASFGSPQATYTPTEATASAGSYGSSGATHTVIVAPTQGVLRYVPFAVNASVGDTIKFVWGANVHTVTKSSQLELCNKTSDAPFASGSQNKSFVFTQVVNDTSPTFYYCGTPTHCQKGMFGIINPPNAANQSSSAALMMASMTSNSSDMAAMTAYTSQMTSNNAAAAAWGSDMDMASMPGWSQSLMAENVLFTRNFLAANPDVMTADGKVDLGAANGNPLMIPQDITAALNAAAPSSSSAAASSAASSTGSAPAASSTAAKSTSGARGLSASGALVGAVAVLAAFVAL